MKTWVRRGMFGILLGVVLFVILILGMNTAVYEYAMTYLFPMIFLSALTIAFDEGSISFVQKFVIWTIAAFLSAIQYFVLGVFVGWIIFKIKN